MGDRALIVITDGESVSPVIYLHWSGYQVPEILTRLKERMKDRTGDTAYAAARLVQEATEGDEGNLSFGIWNADKDLTKAVLSHDAKALEHESHGDAGFVVVSCRDFTWKAYGGYLTEKSAA